MSDILDETFKRAVNSGPERLLAGVALGAAGSGVKDDDFLDAYGTSELDPSSPPASTKSVMWLASCSKLFTSIAALQCVERGLFGLDSSHDVDRLLPEWKNPQILTSLEDDKPVLQDAKEKITLRMLLAHTNGLTYDFFPPIVQWRKSRGEKHLTMREPITVANNHPLIFEPGTGFAYGPGCDVAGLMVARANNCTLEEYMRKNMFDVLGMDDTSFRPMTHNDMAKRMMPPTHRPSPEEPLVDGKDKNPIINVLLNERKDDYGSGGLFGTAEDFLKLLKSILRNDGKLLKPETADLMFTPTLSVSSTAELMKTLSEPAMAAAMIPGEPMVGTPGAGEWTYSLAGLIGLTDNESGFKAGWLQWGGSLNLRWWIDRKGGSCGIFATQLSPPAEEKHKVVANLFQKEMAKRFAKN